MPLFPADRKVVDHVLDALHLLGQPGGFAARRLRIHGAAERDHTLLAVHFDGAALHFLVARQFDSSGELL